MPGSPAPQDTGPIESVRIEKVFVDRIVEKPVIVERIIEKPVYIPVSIEQPEAEATIPRLPAVEPTKPDKTIRSQKPETVPAKNSDSIRKEPNPNSLQPNNSPLPELFGGNKPHQAISLTPYSKVGRPGRQRKYEEEGNRGEIPISEVVLTRHVTGRQYPGLSADMQEWYEHFYFKQPVPGEEPFHGKDYEQHRRAYERGRKWIAEYEAENNSVAPMEDSRIVDLQARRASH